MSKLDVFDLLAIAGAAFITGGIAYFHVGAAFIFVGLVCLVVSLIGAIRNGLLNQINDAGDGASNEDAKQPDALRDE